MNELRLILLVFGLLLVGGVYLYSRFRENSNRGDGGVNDWQETRAGNDPNLVDELDDLPPMAAGDPLAADEGGDEFLDEDPTEPRSARKEMIIALTILPTSSEQRFLGSDLLEIFDRAGLEYGKLDVFHRIYEGPDGPHSVFSVASATEPGSFDVTIMADQTFKGLSMFMLLPGPQRGVDAFADMLATARRIAQQLDADVKDRNRSTLTRQTAHHIREEIIAFEHSLQQGR